MRALFASLAVLLLALDARAEAPAPASRKWTYRGTAGTEADAKPKPLSLSLVEIGRRTLAGRATVDLAVEVDGKRQTREQLAALGLASAPFPVFTQSWSLLLASGAEEARLVGGDQPATPAALKEPMEGASCTWKKADARKKRPKSPRGDRAFGYGKKVGRWPSVCAAFEHPSPESGDFYAIEHCFAPGVGVTRLSFESVWGRFELELVEPPATPDLPAAP